jgi:hypothetical protein
MTRWRQLQESLSSVIGTGPAKPSGFAKVIVDTTVQGKSECIVRESIARQAL